MDFTKAEKRQLRHLAGEVYEAEVRELLEELDEHFQRWRTSEILSSELLQEIHGFHQNQSRDLWSMYQSLDDAMIVERGLRLEMIDEMKVPVSLLMKLRSGG